MRPAPIHSRRTGSMRLFKILMMAILLAAPVGQALAKTAIEWAESAMQKIAGKDYAGALEDLDLGIDVHPQSAMLYEKRGDFFLWKNSYREAIQDYNAALKIDPRLFKALMWRAAAKRQMGDVQGALADYSGAVEINPNSSSAIGWRGIMKGLCDDLSGAVADLNSAIALNPNNFAFIFARASAQDALGNYHKAMADYERGLKLNPTNAQALNYLAWDYAVAPDLDDTVRAKAVELATRACRLTGWKDPIPLDTLAAAYAAIGEYDAAVKCQRACLAQSPDGWLPEAQARLALYQNHQSYVLVTPKSIPANSLTLR